jgi:hypothetical protein
MTREDFLRQEIERYKARIQTYQTMISEWERELGTVSTQTPLTASQEAHKDGKALRSSDPLSLIHGMVFFGKSQPEAAKAFLEMVKYPLTTVQILQGIEKGGVPVGGKSDSSKKTNLYTILSRSAEFVRVKRDTWALEGWPGVPKKNGAEANEAGKNAVNAKEEEPVSDNN